MNQGDKQPHANRQAGYQGQQVAGGHEIVVPGWPKAPVTHTPAQPITPKGRVQAVRQTMKGAEERADEGLSKAKEIREGGIARVLPPMKAGSDIIVGMIQKEQGR